MAELLHYSIDPQNELPSQSELPHGADTQANWSENQSQDFYTNPEGELTPLPCEQYQCEEYAVNNPDDKNDQARMKGQNATDGADGQTDISDNLPLSLSTKEYRLYKLLYQSKGRYISKEEIIQQVWPGHDPADDRVLRATFSRMKKKLPDDLKERIDFSGEQRGNGYIDASYTSPDVLKMGDTEVDMVSGSVRGASTDSMSKLSGREMELLKYFRQHAGRVISNTEIASLFAEHDDPEEYIYYARQLIFRLRRRIGDTGKNPQYIQNIRGEGFIYVPDSD